MNQFYRSRGAVCRGAACRVRSCVNERSKTKRRREDGDLGVSSDLIEHLSHFESPGDVGLGAYARRTAAMRRKSPRLGEMNGDFVWRRGAELASVNEMNGDVYP